MCVCVCVCMCGWVVARPSIKPHPGRPPMVCRPHRPCPTPLLTMLVERTDDIQPIGLIGKRSSAAAVVRGASGVAAPMESTTPELHARAAKQSKEQGQQDAQAAKHGDNVNQQPDQDTQPWTWWAMRAHEVGENLKRAPVCT